MIIGTDDSTNIYRKGVENSLPNINSGRINSTFSCLQKVAPLLLHFQKPCVEPQNRINNSATFSTRQKVDSNQYNFYTY